MIRALFRVFIRLMLVICLCAGCCESLYFMQKVTSNQQRQKDNSNRNTQYDYEYNDQYQYTNGY